MSSSHKLPAGILNTVIVLSLVITGIISALIFLAYYQNLVLLRSDWKQQLTRNAHSGLHYLLANDKIPYSQPYPLDLYGNENDTVVLLKKRWGLFDIVTSTAKKGKNAETVLAQIGALPDRFGRTTLYLADENQPLSISGNTRIVGKCFLPKAGVKASSINNEGYTGTKLIEGETLESKADLPTLDAAFLERLSFYNNPSHFLPEVPSERIIVSGGREFRQSFLKEPLVAYSPNALTIGQTSIQGNILLVADQQVIIESSAQLENVLVIGGNVLIKKGFKGCLQIMARDTIILEESCQLEYPSVLSTYSHNNTSLIALGSGCEVNGVIYAGGQNGKPINKLTVADKTIVKGQVYVNGLVEYRGTLHGNLACRKFFLPTPAALYENQLKDAVLDGSKRSKHFATSQLLSASAPKVVVKWLQ